MDRSHPILFFDGQCGLCDHSVRWCMRHDRRGVLRYAPLQGETYAALPSPDKPLELDTLVLMDEQRLHTHSDAVVRILHHVGGFWKVVGAVVWCVPRSWRNTAYRAVARRRLKWFGGPEACGLPQAGYAQRLLP